MNLIAKQLLEIALADIKASKILYEKKLYPQSFFYFQQATEKSFKALGILSEVIKGDEIEKISHNQLKIYKKMILQQEGEIDQAVQSMKGHEKITDHEFYKNFKFQEYQNQLEHEKQLLDRYGNLNLFEVENDDVIDVLEHLEEVEIVKFNPPKSFIKEFKKGMDQYVSWLGTFNPEAANELKKEIGNDQVIENVAKYSVLYLRSHLSMLFVSKVLYFCTILTMRDHVSSTRYPKNNIHPINFYNKKLPMVKYQSDFIRLLEKATKRLLKTFSPVTEKKG